MYDIIVSPHVKEKPKFSKISTLETYVFGDRFHRIREDDRQTSWIGCMGGGGGINIHVYKSVSFSSFESIGFTLHDLNM